MRIATTEKLKGVLEMPSMGIQINYDHKNKKPREMEINDEHRQNNELLTAVKLGLIAIKKGNVKTKTVSVNEFRLINKTNTPLLLTSLNQPINSKYSCVVDETTLNNPDVRKAIEDGKLDLEQDGKIVNIDMNETTYVKKEIPKDATVATVANPNKEKTLKTAQSIKKKNAPVKKKKDTVLESVPQVYSPTDVVDKDSEEEDSKQFVDKQQELERINSHPKLRKKEPNTVETETVKGERMEGTTPVMIQRSTKKSPAQKSKKSASKKTTSKKTAPNQKTEKPVEVSQQEEKTEVFNLD